MDRPAHLRPAHTDGPLGPRPAALLAFALGIVAFALVAVFSGQLSATPDWRVSLPGFAATSLAAVISVVRRERGGRWLALGGVALAAASLVYGWFVVVAIVIAAAVVAILILHALL